MQFKALRKLTLAGYGHVIPFNKGDIKRVPAVLHAIALDEGMEPQPDDGEELPSTTVSIAEQEVERIAKIKHAMKVILERNKRDDFTAGGIPTTKAIEALCGVKPTVMSETMKLWGEVTAEATGAE